MGNRKVIIIDYGVIRTTFYCLIFGLALAEMAFATLKMVHDGDFVDPFTAVALTIATFQFGWICILLYFNNKPRSKHTLTRSRSHYISLFVFSPFWFGISIFLSMYIPGRCDPGPGNDWEKPEEWCPETIAETVVSWMLCLTALLTGFYIFRRSKTFGPYSNITQDPDGHIALPRIQPENDDLSKPKGKSSKGKGKSDDYENPPPDDASSPPPYDFTSKGQASSSAKQVDEPDMSSPENWTPQKPNRTPSDPYGSKNNWVEEVPREPQRIHEDTSWRPEWMKDDWTSRK